VDIPGFANNVKVGGNYAYIAAGSAGLQIVDVSDRLHPRIAASRSLPGNANDVALSGNLVYVAAGTGGLQIVNVSSPLSPTLAGSLNTGGEAWDVVVKGNRAYVANGANGLVIIDVSNPSSPLRLGSLGLPGVSKGLDVDVVRQIAVVALGTNGLAVVNVATPSSPGLLATLPGGDLRDVAVSGSYAFLADFARSFTSVDLANPSSPVLRGSTPFANGGRLQDVAILGNLAAGADVFFVNGVPIIDVSSPATPQGRIIIDFQAFRDDNGTGIAMDSSYVYLTAEAGTISENGANGTTRLYIGQYQSIQDNLGVPPVIQITSPASGSQIIQGSTVTVTANATDDVAVAAVNFLVNGQLAFTATNAPYQYTFTAPSTGSTLTLGATAVDFGGNVGAAPSVMLNLISDPLTTAIGRVIVSSGAPVAGATVSALGRSTTSLSDGTFALPGLPTVQGPIVVQATATVNGINLIGSSTATQPVLGGTTSVGNILIACTTSVTFIEYPAPSPGSGPHTIISGPDGNLWFTEEADPNSFGNRGNRVGRITPTGVITEFVVPTIASSPTGITAGPDGNLWFAEYFGQKIGRITLTGVITEFPLPGGGFPYGITAGPDGNLWFVERFGNSVGRMTTSGTITEFPIPTSSSQPFGITAGLDGNLWFTESSGNKIGRISTAGVITEFALPTSSGNPYWITAGPDGNMWFTEGTTNKIGRITPAGVITEFPVPTANSGLSQIGPGPDGNLWFTERSVGKIGRITPGGVITEFPVPTAGAGPEGITTGPDGKLWFTEATGNKIVKANVPTCESLTTVIGRVVDSGTDPVLGATVRIFNQYSSTTGTSGSFSRAGVPTTLGAIMARASAVVGGTGMSGVSSAVSPVLGGTTNVGDITLASCVSIPGLVSFWTGDTSGADIIGGKDVTAQGSATFGPARIANGFKMTAVGDAFHVPDSPIWHNQQFTVEAWVRASAAGSGDGVGVVAVKVLTDAPHELPYNSWILVYQPSTGTFMANVQPGFSTGFSGYVQSPPSFSSGQLHHVAMTYDGTLLKLYVNGAMQGQTTLPGPIQYSNQRLGIGGHAFGGYPYDRTLIGEVDEVGIFNRTLTAAEVLAIFQAGSAGKCLP
jgi:streptogramin lyase